MSIFGKGNTPENTPAADPPADPPVTRSEFSALDGRLAKLTESIEQLASRPVVVQAAAPEAPLPPTDVADEDIDAAIAEGKGAARVKELISRKIDAAKREMAGELGTFRNYGTTMLGSLAERTFVAALDQEDKALFTRFEKEVRGLVNQCDPALRGHPDTWETSFNAVVGQHRHEISAERVEAERRRIAEESAAPPPTPGNSGSPRSSDVNEAAPTIQELAGEFPHLGDMTEDEFIRKINRGKPSRQRYKDWNDYITRGREIDKQLAAMHDGSDVEDGDLPRSLQ